MTSARTPPLFAARQVGFGIGDDGAVIPTVGIDVDGHPDVADLARVNAVDGSGDVRTTAQRVVDGRTEILLLGVALTRPVRAAFAVSFELPDHREFLELAGARGQLAIATTDPADVADDPPLWLAVDLDGPALLGALR